MTTITCAAALTDTDFAEHLAHLRGALETRLEQLLPAVGHERDLLAEGMRHCTLAPGKRLRPLLLALLVEDLGACPQAALQAGCAIEMVHAASLVLDDLPCMDDAALRRGRPTLHRAFGEDVAILAAIALLSRAFGLLSALETLSPRVRNALVATLSETIGVQGLVKGQLQDLRDGATPRTAEQIAETNQLKTGVLFGAIVEMACRMANASLDVSRALHAFAEELGQAFQLLDDLKDGDSNTGKDCLKDQGKSTLFALCGEKGTRQRLDAHLAAANQCLVQAGLGGGRIASLLQASFSDTRSNLPSAAGSAEHQSVNRGGMQ